MTRFPGLQPLDPLRLGLPRTGPRVPQITPEEEESLLGWAGRKGLSGLAWIGLTLDKPGAAVRGLLAGKPEQLLNLIPFSDTLGITDPDERVYGRELLEMAGAPKNRPGLFNSFEDFLWDVAGLGTEIVTDPLMLVTGVTGTLTTKGAEAFRGIPLSGKLAEALPQFKKAVAALEEVRGTGKTVGVLEGPKMARTLGRTAADYAAEIRSGERALFGLGLPGGAPLATFGKGEWAAKAIEKLWYSKLSVIPWTRYAFSHKAWGVPTGAAQMAKDAMFSHAAQLTDLAGDMAPALRTTTNELAKMWDDLARNSLKKGDQLGFETFSRDMHTTYGELLQQAGGMEILNREIRNYLSAPLNTPAAVWEKDISEFSDRLYTYLDAQGTVTRTLGEAYRAAGGNLGMLDDQFMKGYHPRRPSHPGAMRQHEKALEDYVQLFGHYFPFASPRNPFLKHWPERTRQINRVAQNARITATIGKRDKKEFTEVIQTILEDDLRVQAREMAPGDLHKLADLYGIEYAADTPPDVILQQVKEFEPFLEPHGLSGAKAQQAYLWHKEIQPALQRELLAGRINDVQYGDEVSRWLKNEIIEGKELGPRIERAVEYFAKLPEDILQTGLFDRRMVDDLADYTAHMSHSLGTVLAAHHFLAGENIVWKAGEKAQEGVSLKNAWNRAGFTDEGLANWMRRKFGEKSVGPLKIKNPETGLLEETGERAKLAELVADPQVPGVLNAYVESMKPLNIGKIGEFYDKANSLYKGWLVMAPSFHTRNLVGGVFQWWSEGVLNLDDILGGIWDAMRHVHSRGKKPLQHIDEILADDFLASSGGTQVAGAAAQRELGKVPEGFLGGIFTPEAGLPAERLAGSKWRRAMPWAQRGVSEGRQNLLAAASEKAYSFIEFLLRAGPYDRLRKRGFSPSQARHIVFRTQFDYGRASKFERQIMTRAVPFWRWARNNIPRQIELLLSRPGGRSAQTIRMMAGAQRESGQGGYLPPWMRERAAVRTTGPEEAATFLTQAGLPLEDLTRFQFKGGTPDVWNTARRFAADMHPLILSPVEAFAGKQVWSGRKLKDLRPITGQPTLDFLIARSPFSRQVFETRRAIDPRKSKTERALDLLTGFKFHTVDLPQAKLREMERLISEKLREHPEVRTLENLYIPKKLKKEAPQETLRELELLNQLILARRQLAAERARE